MTIRQSRSRGTGLTLAKDGRKTEEASENSVSCVRAVCNQSVTRSGDEDRTKRLQPEIKTNLMVATVVTNPNIHYLLTCSPDRHDCELLLAGGRYDFTP